MRTLPGPETNAVESLPSSMLALGTMPRVLSSTFAPVTALVAIFAVVTAPLARSTVFTSPSTMLMLRTTSAAATVPVLKIVTRTTVRRRCSGWVDQSIGGSRHASLFEFLRAACARRIALSIGDTTR